MSTRSTDLRPAGLGDLPRGDGPRRSTASRCVRSNGSSPTT